MKWLPMRAPSLVVGAISIVGLSGLMEVAAHPDFEDNGLVYLTYTRRLDGGHGTVALVRGRFDGNVLRDVEDVFVAEPWMRQVAVDDPNVLVGSTVWRHEKISLKPVNLDFEPIVLTGADEGELQVIAELVKVLGG